MFTIRFDSREIEAFAKNTKHVEIDVQKAIQWYINQVYRDLSKQHGRPYTYVTPPGSRAKNVNSMGPKDRKNIRKRSGKLLNDLKQSKFVLKRGEGLYEAGFDIRPGSYLSRHVGERSDPPQVFTVGDVDGSQRLGMRVMIPLRAALNPNGTPKPLTDRHRVHVTPFRIFMNWKSGKSGFEAMHEDASKFEDYSLIVWKQSGRLRIPLYVLAKKFSVPKRIFIGEKMLQYYDDIYDRLDLEISKALDRMK